MALIAETMTRFFKDDDWKYEQVEPGILKMGVSGKNGKWVCFAQAREEQEQFVFYSLLPTNVPEPKRQAMSEFLTRANWGLVMGNFEMDLSDGEVRYKTALDVEGDCVSPSLIRNTVLPNVRMMDRYLPGIMGVIYGSMSPEQALQQVEK